MADNNNKSFLVMLGVVVVAGAALGTMSYGVSGNGSASGVQGGGPVPNAPKPSAADTASEPAAAPAPEPTADASADGHPAEASGPALEPYNPNKPPAVDPPGPPADEGTTDATPQ